MSNLIVLRGAGQPATPPINDAAVVMLRDLLTRAERGEVQAVALAALHVIDGKECPGHGIAVGGAPFLLLGALEVVRSRVLAHIDT
jgi:hypothetical protein